MKSFLKSIYLTHLARIKQSHMIQSIYDLIRVPRLKKYPGPYSQDGIIDVVTNRLFMNCSSGFFVDVGAYDGVTFSNTRHLFLRGWSGICIEPSPNNYRILKKVYSGQNRVKLVNLGDGSCDKDAEFFEGGTLSTFSGHAFELFGKLPWSKHINWINHFTIKMKTLDMILEENAAPLGFEVLSIDVEGTEYEVLKGFTIAKWLPRVVIIELLRQERFAADDDTWKLQKDSSEKIDLYFLESGYHRGEFSQLNTVYYRNEKDILFPKS